jgi:hypothetical protein
MNMLSKSQGVEVRGAHPSKTAKGGAAPSVIVQKWASPLKTQSRGSDLPDVPRLERRAPKLAFPGWSVSEPGTTDDG